jgi:hypothetical protein
MLGIAYPDFTQSAAGMRESGERLAESLGVGKGLKVLDLGPLGAPEKGAGARTKGVERPRVW